MAEIEEQTKRRTDEVLASIGEAYYRGMLGMPVNYDEAFRYYAKAAGMGNPSAMNMVARCYEYGQGTRKNILSALDWYENASDKGNVAATVRLGDFYRDGIDHVMQKDLEKAVSCYKNAFAMAEKWNDLWDAPDVYIRLADCIFYGIGFEKDLDTAMEYYNLASDGYKNRIEAGDSSAENGLELAEKGARKCAEQLGIDELADPSGSEA